MKFAICNELFENWEWTQLCAFTKEAGYDGLEVAPYTLGPSLGEVTDRQLANLRQRANEAGVQIVGLHWLLARTSGLHVTSPDPSVRRQTSHYLVRLAHVCEQLGGAVMVLGSPRQRSLLPGVSREQAHDFAAETLGEALEGVAGAGVTIALEPLGASETDFLNTCEEADRLIRRIGHTNLRLHLDVKAMSSEASPIHMLIEQFGPSAVHFHASEPNLRGPGFGDTDFVPVFRALRRSGYQGWVSVEVFDFDLDSATVATGSIAYMKRCLATVSAHI